MFKIKKIIKNLRYKGDFGYFLARILTYLNRFQKGSYLSDKAFITKRFLKAHSYPINWNDPQSLNEKLQILKWKYTTHLHSNVSDKFSARDFINKKFGEEFLIPLVFETKNPNEITPASIPDFPVIVKANHDAGNNYIIRDKKNVEWDKLQKDCRWWLSWNYYYADREQQYKNIERRIIVEKLLITDEGKIPNDYKLNFINGNLEFVYVSIDREGGNYRNIYDANWIPLNFKWANKNKMPKTKRGPEIGPPQSWELMRKLGGEIAQLFPYVRVDFYDVNGKPYFGEITLCHGGGFDKFEPLEVDFELGKKLSI
ncbi:MAG: glycosyl transferase [Bacteroidia bacterium]|nr:glycosyl transferase [Bacteroidia bacterium]MCF8445923.1 glycosyl transferase [Bacteroidia bacterium]